MAPTQTAAQTVSLPIRDSLAVRAARAAEIAAAHADQVDSASRFPQEALDALRQEKLLGIMVPRPLGGEQRNTRSLRYSTDRFPSLLTQ